MKRLLGTLMMVGLWSGCGGVSPTDIDDLKEENNQLRDEISDISSKLDSLSQEDREEFLIFRGTWEDGGVKEEYQYYHHPENNKRIKDGWYKSYYEDGGYNEVGTYKDNNRVDEWSHFTEDGEETKGIYDNGNKWSGEFWISVKIDSFWVETEDETPDDNKVWTGLFTYDDGLWNGLVVLYWMNGNKRSEGLYEDGKHEGYYKKYTETGERVWEGHFIKGKLEGERVGYYESGKVKFEEYYLNDKLDGTSVWYYENGSVWVEEYYTNGKLDGKQTWYYDTGRLFDEDIYENGVCVEMCEGDEEGL